MYKFLVECEHLPVPVDFVKNHLKDANGAYVKVYLYILYLATVNLEMSFSDIARELNLIESDDLLLFSSVDREGKKEVHQKIIDVVGVY